MFVSFERYPVRPLSFGGLFDTAETIDSMLDGMFSWPQVVKERSLPVIDVAEHPSETVIVAELPGVAKEDVSVSFDRGVLTISGERKQAATPEGASTIRQERPFGKFTRTITIGHDVKADAINAELANGILRIVIPKADEARPREIEVR